MKRLWVILFYTVLSSQNLLPKSGSGEKIINHSAYSLSYNEEHEQANWVAYKLTAEKVRGSVKRKDAFRADPKVETGSASLDDYRGSGYDRGHLAPAADMKWSSTAMSESFFMSNMSPQNPGFNRGIWKRLEEHVRNWAIDNESIHITTGGVLKGKLTTIGNNSVSVPNFYYKVILDYEGPEIKGIGFILRNENAKNSLDTYAVSIDDVERFTGLDFYHSLPDNIEEKVESTVDVSKWNFKSSKASYPKSDDSKIFKTDRKLPNSVQCKGTTKKGTRCSRKTKSINGFCFQHGGS